MTRARRQAEASKRLPLLKKTAKNYDPSNPNSTVSTNKNGQRCFVIFANRNIIAYLASVLVGCIELFHRSFDLSAPPAGRAPRLRFRAI
jgi:hypothetical protein